MSKFGLMFLAVVAVSSLTLAAQSYGWPPSADRPTITLWPGAAPGASANLPPEADTTTAKDNLIAGRPLIRLGNVSKPTLTLYRPKGKTPARRWWSSPAAAITYWPSTLKAQKSAIG